MNRLVRFAPVLFGQTRYLLRDEFKTDLAAGAVNGTLAEPDRQRLVCALEYV